MNIVFENGVQFELSKNITASSAVIENHKRDVLNVTMVCSYEEAKSAFNGQGWLVADDNAEYDKSNYTLVASICDNMDGTITVRVGRQNTTEETLLDEKNVLLSKNDALQSENVALTAMNTELNAQIDELIIEVLEGGTDNVPET